MSEMNNCAKRRESERHETVKHLAEMAWVAVLMGSGGYADGNESTAASDAWIAAEAMHAESERRRPQE